MTLAGKIIIPLLILGAVMTVLLLVGWEIGLIPWLLEPGRGARQRQHRHHPLHPGGDGDPALHRPDRLRDHLHGDEGDRLPGVTHRPQPHRAVGHACARCSPASRCSPRKTSRPPARTSPVFTIAPIVTYLAAVLTLLVIPFAPGLVGYDMNIGLLYFFAVRRPDRGGPDDGRLVELQQVLAARRIARRGPDRQLRAAARARAGRRDHACRHAVAERHRPAPGRLVLGLVRVPAAARLHRLLHRRHR